MSKDTGTELGLQAALGLLSLEEALSIALANYPGTRPRAGYGHSGLAPA